MLITPHALASSAVSQAITNNIFVAFFVSMALHFILDALPHLDPGTLRYKMDEPNRKPKWGTEHIDENSKWPKWVYVAVISDFLVAILIYVFLLSKLSNFSVLLAGGLGGISIDLIDNPLISFYKLPVFSQLHWLHHKVHFDLPQRYWFWGIPLQIIILGGSLWLLLK
jgi:uncharacterized integral membrane protein